MGYFPFFVNIENKEILVVGGGKVAFRKISTILEFGPKVTIIAEKFCDDVIEISKKSNIKLIQRDYFETDITNNNYFCVISATNDEEVNNSISKECMARNILVNIADDIEKCNFIFPAVVKDKDIVIGVSTSGKSPLLSKIIKQNIIDIIPTFYGDLVFKLGLAREKIKCTVHVEEKRKKVLQQVTELGLEKKGNITEEHIQQVIDLFDKRGN